MSKNAVISQVQQKSGIFISGMSGARMFRMVVMMLMAPMMEEIPIRWTAKIAMSIPIPCWVDRGA